MLGCNATFGRIPQDAALSLVSWGVDIHRFLRKYSKKPLIWPQKADLVIDALRQFLY